MSNITFTVDEIIITAPASAITVDGKRLSAPTIKKLSAKTHDRFIEYYNDSGNWSGSPLVGCNVGGDSADKGYILNMKKAGMVSTFGSGVLLDAAEAKCWATSETWIEFSEKAHEYFMQYYVSANYDVRKWQKAVFGYEP